MKKKGRLETGSVFNSTPTTSKPGTSSSVGQGSSTSTRNNIVEVMQDTMSDIAKHLTIPENARKFLTNASIGGNVEEDVKYITSKAPLFGNTSGFGAGSARADGIWGKNTKQSLVTIKEFIQKFQLLGVVLNEGAGTVPYKEMKPDELEDAARSNISNLYTLANMVGASVKKVDVGKSSSEKGKVGAVLDWVKQALVTEDATSTEPFSPERMGQIPVTAGDIRDFGHFFNFIQTLSYGKCVPLSSKKASLDNIIDEIKTSSLIFKSAQEAERAIEPIIDPWNRQEKKEESITSGVCINVIDQFIAWFRHRSVNVYGQLVRLVKTGNGKHPLNPENDISTNDIKAAGWYRSAIGKLDEQWAQLRPNVESILRERGLEAKPVVTKDILIAAGDSSSVGAAKQTSKEVEIPSDVYGKKGDVKKGPLARYMRLDLLTDLADQGQIDRLRKLTPDGRLPTIDLEHWMRGSWINLAKKYIAGDKISERLGGFIPFATLLRDTLQSMKDTWEDEFGKDIGERVSRQQNRLLTLWTRYITSKIAQAHKYGAMAISKAREMESEKR